MHFDAAADHGALAIWIALAIALALSRPYVLYFTPYFTPEGAEKNPVATVRTVP